MIHLAVPVLLAALLAGAGAYGMVARRNAVLVLIGVELLLNAVNLLLVTVAALPAGGLAVVADGPAEVAAGVADPLLAGQVLAIFVVTVAAAEIGVALAVVLLLFRARGTIDLAAVTELGEASPDYSEQVGAGSWPEPVDAPSFAPAEPVADAGPPAGSAGAAGPADAAGPSDPAGPVDAPGAGQSAVPATERGR